MLQDLERLFWKSNSSLDKFGFPISDGVPTELAEDVSLWMSLEIQTRQGQLLDSLKETQPNNDKQQKAFDLIMGSIINFKDATKMILLKTYIILLGVQVELVNLR